MRVAWCVPRYPPVAPCGAEWTAHELLAECARRGHGASAIVVGPERHYYGDVAGVDDVRVWTAETAGHDSYDVVIGHLGYAGECRRFLRPGGMVVWMAHAPYQYAWGADAAPDHYIANAAHVAAAGPPGTWIMRPHVDPARVVARGVDVDVHGGDAVTLIGASDLKGIGLFRQIARARPRRDFRVVHAGYDRQRIGPGQRGNIDVWTVQADIRPVYAGAAILCVPSVESWGRVAVEAAHNGIPTIGHPSAGLDESMGDVYLPAPRDNLRAWLDAIDYLDDAEAYDIAAETAHERAMVVDGLTSCDRDDIIRRLEAIA